MTYIAVFDIGTTAVKGLLIDKQVNIVGEHIVELTTYAPSVGIVEQDPTDWWQAVKTIAANWWENGIDSQSIRAITFSGQMEDVITLSKKDKHYRAILYSDVRPAKETKELQSLLPDIRLRTGNNISATTPLSKITWLMRNQREQYNDTRKFVFCSKDYVIYQLTNKAVVDPVTASTTGMMDLRKQVWDKEIISTCNIDSNKLPHLIKIDDVVGNITKEASEETGFAESTLVINGSGDAGASTLGASAVHANDCYFYMGTTGWLAMIQENEDMENLSEGHFNLAFVEDHLISVAPLLNVGNIHKWAVDTYINPMQENAGGSVDKYQAFEDLISNAEPCSEGVVFLPYLHGERNPIMDADAKGAYWGIHANTERRDLARAALEGVTFSLKQTLDMYDLKDNRMITLIGGASKSETWCQMMADVMDHAIRVPLNSEYLPSIGIASTAFLALGWTETYESFIDAFVNKMPSKKYYPNDENVQKYAIQYEAFKKVYPALKAIYI